MKAKRKYTEETARRRARMLGVCLTAEEYAGLDAKAKAEGLSLSGLVRSALEKQYGLTFEQRGLSMRSLNGATKEQQAAYLRRKLAELEAAQ